MLINNTHLTDLSFISCKSHLNLNLSQAFKQTVLYRATPVLFRNNKSDKVNDQRRFYPFG